MRDRTSQPLANRLTRRMIWVQLVTLAIFFSLILIPVFILPVVTGVKNVHPPDPAVLKTVEESLSYGPDGILRLEPTPALEKLAADYPTFWILAVGTDDHQVSFGPIPPEAEALRQGLRQIVSLQVILELETGSPTLLVRTANLPGGVVKIALGGGPTLMLPELIRATTLTLMVAVLGVLAAASALTIPRFIRQELQGLSAAATAAGSIDIDQRGTRIPEAGLPTEVLALVNAMNTSLERLDEAQLRRERFLADAAHELRTPIAILSARIETAEPFAEKQKLLDDIVRLAELTNQLLDVQRLTLSDVAFTPVDLVEIGISVVGGLAPLAINAGYELELDAPDAPVIVSGDQASLERAVSNIVRNAITHGGGSGRITVEVRSPGSIAVSDEGPGIPEGAEQQIFEPFHRLKPSPDGAGLGLSLVDNIVRRHNATITVSRPEVPGARFTISFPAA